MNFKIVTLAAGAGLAAMTPVLAQTASPPAPTVTLGQAVAVAEQTLGARAYDAELDREHGVLVYEVDLVKDGRAMEAEVDAASGKLVRRAGPVAVRLPFTGEHLRMAQSAPRTLTQTIALVEGATKGRVSEIGLERDGGRYHYEAELTGAPAREVRVDLRTGAITPVIDD